jgi:hypothetical protein
MKDAIRDLPFATNKGHQPLASRKSKQGAVGQRLLNFSVVGLGMRLGRN